MHVPGLTCRHLELNGEEFPFSRGLSFYELNDDGKIISARDVPEPTFKPGDAAFYVSKPPLACMVLLSLDALSRLAACHKSGPFFHLHMKERLVVH